MNKSMRCLSVLSTKRGILCRNATQGLYTQDMLDILMAPRNTITVQGMKKPGDRYVPFLYLPREVAKDAGIEKGTVLTVSSPKPGVIVLKIFTEPAAPAAPTEQEAPEPAEPTAQPQEPEV